jgi:hypothetical protein
MVTQERAELDPLPAIFGRLPTAQDLKRQVLEAIDEGYNQLVRARGEVTRPEDTYEVQRRLAGAEETLREFEQAFAGGRKVINSYQKEEFELALGDREVQPHQSMSVPDAEGDLRVAADTANSYSIDLLALIVAAAKCAFDGRDPGYAPLTGGMHRIDTQVENVVNGDSEIPPEDLPEVLVEYAMATAYELLRCGKFEPQISKVRAYADMIARAGDDKLAATVNSAIVKTVKLKGVKVERKAAK